MNNYITRPSTASNAVEMEIPFHNAISVRLTEIIQASDPHAKYPRMKEARAAEIRDLVRRGTFKILLPTEIPPNANMLAARFVLAIKHKITGEVKFKATFVIKMPPLQEESISRTRLSNSSVYQWTFACGSCLDFQFSNLVN